MTGIVCIITLFAVYGALIYIGATASGIYAQDTAQTALFPGVTRQIMGTAGLACMGGATAITYLTTTVGIRTTVISFIYRFPRERVPYKLLMPIACIIGVLMGITGIQNIVNYVTLISLVICLVRIVIIILGLPDRFPPSNGFYKGGVLMAGIVSLEDVALSVVPDIGWLKDLMSTLPLSDLDFARPVPAVIDAVVGVLPCGGKERYQAIGDPVAEEIAKNK